ncbi:MAG: class I poly(R)-hydroxyalkanoic acid synthase [Zoogloea sp.]|uniref:PHA/PHB synthase family protein n=1 Tax=Zoogloea sp. TaxID=49181 RepID=UPI00263A2F4C|nr:class I poly(R)-hydroxyalkanoic acid synthase [Zoogloea sp.]MDD2990091.1 class I poly(R)-hydroxyalkanoic acid synthase [Zoogloea sp.]
MTRHSAAPSLDLARKSIQQFHDSVESSIDPLGMAAPLVHAQLAWAAHPQELAQALAKVSSSLWELQWHSWRRMLGLPSADPVKPHGDDTRFTDPVWAESPTWDLSKEWYLVLTRHMQDMLYETPGLSQKERRRAAFWWRNWLNAVAPSNFLWTNPVAMRLAVESKGESLVRGFRNFLADMEAGNIRMTDPDDFKVGQNLATTPGKVVFRNRLLEVLHYTPTCKRVYQTPIVIVTPWINKFYILDLNPKKSMIRFLLDQGFEVFITSWKNPGEEMRDVSFDDYLVEGVQALVDTARGLTGAAKVHAVGYCIGGTALSTYMAWANRHFAAEDVPVAHFTLFTTLVDFHKPGDIEVFVDEGSIRFITQNMARKGYLDGAEMASSFRLLRSNSLIWHYVVHGWLYGETPPPFDVLFWNMDTTRMPYAMHAWYLRELYLHNKLIEKDALTVAGEPIDLGAIVQPVYAVSAEDDHIAPWRQTFRTMNYVAGSKRFVLSSSGHILGIVNPPVKPPKRQYWVAPARCSDTAEGWRGAAVENAGSWWDDWMAWLKPQAGEMVEPAPVSSKAYPALADAPGTYVLEP